MTEAPRGSLASVAIYTDGGADPNPGPGGWGAVLVHPASGRTEELSGGEPHTTNNRMELTAAIQALERLERPCRVELHTDSRYLQRGVSEWLPEWVKRGWRRRSGELQNEDLWRRLAAAVTRHQVTWKWLKGHAGHPRNERADRLAAAAIREQRAARALSRRGGGGAAEAAAGEGGAGGAAAPAPADFEVFLRVSMSARGAGWAALIRPAALAAGGEDAGGGAEGRGGESGGAPGAERVLTGSLPPGAAVSSNALDLAAALAAIEALPPGASAEVHTVSDYLRLGASQWLPAWRRRGWKTQEGAPVRNRDLWERLAAALATRRIRWPDVRDAEVPELDRLAPLAKAAAQPD
jgi:ribonuclease HI